MPELAAATYPIGVKAEAAIVKAVKTMIAERTSLSSLRSKLEISDRLVAREPAKGKPRLEVTIPVISPEVETMTAYLAGTFLNTKEVFPIEGSESQSYVVDAINDKFSSYARDWQWSRNLILGFKDASKYNLMVLEATWKEVKTSVVSQTAITVGTQVKQQLATKTQKAGFSIKHLDPYNAFWDMGVAPAELASEGEFAGYFEVMNKIKLHRFLLSLPSENGYQSRKTEIIDSISPTINHYVPSIVEYSESSGVTNWAKVFGDVLGRQGSNKDKHEVVTIYCRIIPADLEMTRVPQPKTPQIWKFVIVNYKYVVYAECRTNAHDYLPIIIGIPNETNLGYQQKTLPEELESIQDLASQLMTMEVESNRRIIADRMIYNAQMISSADINSPNPAAKIASRSQAMDQDISKAIHQIPYNDPALGTRQAMAQSISGYASAIVGSNQVSKGGFVKGNKTNDQFNEVLSRSDARQTSMAILLEDQAFSVLKHILLYDFIQYQSGLKAYDEATGQPKLVDISILLDEELDFVINDALSLAKDDVSSESIMTAMQTLQASPQLMAKFDDGKLYSLLMEKLGIHNLQDLLLAKQPAQQQGNPIQSAVPPPQGGQLQPSAQSPASSGNFDQTMSNLLQQNGEQPNAAQIPPA